MVNLERTGPVCERSEMKEHRTRGGADGMEWRRTFRAVNLNEHETYLIKGAGVYESLL